LYTFNAELLKLYANVVYEDINAIFLARSAKLPTGLYILLALISFFLSIFNDFSDNNYLRIRWTDFCNLFTE